MYDIHIRVPNLLYFERIIKFQTKISIAFWCVKIRVFSPDICGRRFDKKFIMRRMIHNLVFLESSTYFSFTLYLLVVTY